MAHIRTANKRSARSIVRKARKKKSAKGLIFFDIFALSAICRSRLSAAAAQNLHRRRKNTTPIRTVASSCRKRRPPSPASWSTSSSARAHSNANAEHTHPVATSRHNRLRSKWQVSVNYRLVTISPVHKGKLSAYVEHGPGVGYLCT